MLLRYQPSRFASQLRYYQPKFARHLHHLAINGFFARELDADDHQFLEQVKVRGIANGTLPNTSTGLFEELEFWRFPYTVAPGIERRAGPVERYRETPEARELRLQRWRAHRAQQAAWKAEAAAELERERKEWVKAKANRKVREELSDAEWEAAKWGAPTPFGRIEGRHYIPQWRVDEQLEHAKQIFAASQAKAIAKEKRAAKAKRATQAAEERDAKFAQAVEERDAERAAQERRAAAEQNVHALARAAAHQKAQQWNIMGAEATNLKYKIKKLVDNSPHRIWTDAEFMRELKCTDEKFLIACLDQMIADRQIGIAPA